MKKCPNDGAAMVLIWEDTFGASFLCPVCDGTGDTFYDHNPATDILKEKPDAA